MWFFCCAPILGNLYLWGPTLDIPAGFRSFKCIQSHDAMARVQFSGCHQARRMALRLPWFKPYGLLDMDHTRTEDMLQAPQELSLTHQFPEESLGQNTSRSVVSCGWVFSHTFEESSQVVKAKDGHIEHEKNFGSLSTGSSCKKKNKSICFKTILKKVKNMCPQTLLSPCNFFMPDGSA